MSERTEDNLEPLPLPEKGWTVKSINGHWDARAYSDTLVFTKAKEEKEE